MASAVENTNNYSPANDYVSQNTLYRTNPWAGDDSLNSIHLMGIDTNQARHNGGFSWAVVSGGAHVRFVPKQTLEFLQESWDSDSYYQKWTVVDKSGNESYAVAVGFESGNPTAARQVNTSALDKDNDWKVLFSTSNNDGATKVDFSFTISEGAIRGSSSATISYTNIED